MTNADELAQSEKECAELTAQAAREFALVEKLLADGQRETRERQRLQAAIMSYIADLRANAGSSVTADLGHIADDLQAILVAPRRAAKGGDDGRQMPEVS